MAGASEPDVRAANDGNVAASASTALSQRLRQGGGALILFAKGKELTAKGSLHHGRHEAPGIVALSDNRRRRVVPAKLRKGGLDMAPGCRTSRHGEAGKPRRLAR